MGFFFYQGGQENQRVAQALVSWGERRENLKKEKLEGLVPFLLFFCIDLFCFDYHSVFLSHFPSVFPPCEFIRSSISSSFLFALVHTSSPFLCLFFSHISFILSIFPSFSFLFNPIDILLPSCLPTFIQSSFTFLLFFHPLLLTLYQSCDLCIHRIIRKRTVCSFK